MTIRAAFIGTGGIANHHIKQMTQGKGYSFVAACDLNEQRVQDFCKKWDIARHYTNMDKLLENENIQAVFVCTPNYAHKEPTIKALKAGVNVYCEKPMAMNVAEAEAMVKAARKSKAILTIGHHMRFLPKNQFIHKERLAGGLGEIYFCRTAYHRRGGVPWWGEFHIKQKSGGGALIDVGVHIIDLALWLMGSPNPVQVMGQTYGKLAGLTDGQRPNQNADKAAQFDVDDFASGFVKMDNGATLAIECSWAANRAQRDEQILEICGDKGGVLGNPLTIFTQRHGEFINVAPPFLPELQPHGAATEHFRKVIKGEAENLVKPEETLNVQKILDGVYRSSETGKAVAY